MNLLPWREKIYEKKRNFFCGCLCVAALLSVIFLFGSHQYYVQKREKVLSLLQAKKKEKQQNNSNKKLSAERLKQVNFLKKRLKEEREKVTFLKHLSQVRLKKHFYLRSLTQEKDQIWLEGFTESMPDLFELTQLFRGAPGVLSVQLAQAKQNEMRGVEFKLTIGVAN